MDAAATGALIGIGIMLCGLATMVCNAKIQPYIDGWIQRYKQKRQQTKPLLPVVKSNPMIVGKRNHSKVKNLFPGK